MNRWNMTTLTDVRGKTSFQPRHAEAWLPSGPSKSTATWSCRAWQTDPSPSCSLVSRGMRLQALQREGLALMKTHVLRTTTGRTGIQMWYLPEQYPMRLLDCARMTFEDLTESSASEPL